MSKLDTSLTERLLECAPAAEAFGRPDMALAMREAALEIARLESLLESGRRGFLGAP